MSNEFIVKNVDEISENSQYDFPLNLAMASAWILGNLKGVNLKILEMKKSPQASLADFYVLASASNPNQASAMANEIIVQMKRKGMNVISKEGSHQGADWILLDLGDFIVHIFQETSRDVYDLDNLWEAPSIQIPNEYYYSDEVETSDDDKGYF
jgi:ribosome-associated protein